MKQLWGVALLFIVGCAVPDTTESDTSNLSSQWNNEYRYDNVALSGTATSSNTTTNNQPASRINDGIRGAPWDPITGMYKFWASTAIYNSRRGPHCNYQDWWVRIDFAAPPGGFCPYDPGTHRYYCAHNISEIDLFSLQDDYWSGADPTPTTQTTAYGNTDVALEYCPTGATCLDDGTGWVEPTTGGVSGNTLAWTKVSFPAVSATSVRAKINCVQGTYAYVTELEAWEQQAAPPLSTYTIPPSDNLSWYVGDDNSMASIVADSDRFWWRFFGTAVDVAGGPPNCTASGGIGGGSNGIPDDVDNDECFINMNSPGADGTPGGGLSAWWSFGEHADSLIRMYDLLAPIDANRAIVYLERLRQFSKAFLRQRDDKRGTPVDACHQNRQMAGWGSYNSDCGGQWVAQVDLSGLFTYPMAAFAKRVAANPDWFPAEYRDDAIQFTNAVVETYVAFRSDIQWSDANRPGGNSSWSYYMDFNGDAEPFNVTLSSLRSMAEVASAADSDLYKTSLQYDASTYYYATVEAPYLIARTAKFFVDNLEAGDPAQNAGDVPWSWWRYAALTDNGQFPENLSHADLTIGSLLLLWEDGPVLDAMLARNGNSERVSSVLTSAMFTNIANTFLGRVWYYDYDPYNYQFRNLLTDRIDGPNSNLYHCGIFGTDCDNAPIPSPFRDHSQTDYPLLDGNASGGGFAPLAQFSPWVWNRLRDSTFNTNLEIAPGCYPGPQVDGVNYCTWQALTPENHSELLRYRAYMAPD